MKKIFLMLTLLFVSYSFAYDDIKKAYLDLMKKCLTGLIYQDKAIYTNQFKESIRENGLDWPQFAHTMIGFKRIENIEFCVNKILEDNIPGDFIETGVWRGGAVIFMQALLKANNITNRQVWVADSFQGLPEPDVEKYPQDKNLDLSKIKELAVSEEQVKNNFIRYGLLDSNIQFLKGWFKDTLHIAPIQQLALLRLDGDLYESTMDALVALYSKLSVGGFVIVDDYGVAEPCAQAINDFRRQHNISDQMHQIDASGAVFWRKSK